MDEGGTPQGNVQLRDALPKAALAQETTEPSLFGSIKNHDRLKIGEVMSILRDANFRPFRRQIHRFVACCWVFDTS
jgi:hypothetical protein